MVRYLTLCKIGSWEDFLHCHFDSCRFPGRINMNLFSKYLQCGPAILAMAAALSACGGGGGGGAPSTPAPTPSAPVPSALADSVVVSYNKNTTLTVLANDSATNSGTPKLVSASTPAHGTATVSGDTIVYAPTAGYIGQDTFSYTINAGAGSATSTAAVSVTVNADLTLAGKAVDMPANAIITVTVGAKTSSVTADASGNFSAPVALDTPASMITITAQGSGAQSHVKLISLVGDSQLVLGAAGAAASVTPDMLAGLKVSNFSTALYAHATRKNGGVVPATQQALDGAAANVGASELLQMAAVIRSLTGSTGVAPRRSLPGGAADVLALVGNSVLYTQFVKQIAPSALFTEIGAMYGDASLLASVPAIAVASAQSLNFYGNEACCVTPATELVLNPDGSGSILKDQQRVAGTWTRDASALTLTLTTPVLRSEMVDGGTVPPTQVEVQTLTKQFIIRQVTGSFDHGFATIAQAGTIHYPGGQREDGTFVSSTMSAFSGWSRLAAPADVGGSTLGGIPDLVNVQAVGLRQLIMALAADGSASSPQLPLLPASWQAQNGKLVVDMGSGRVQTMARLSVAANGEERWLARAAAGADYALHEFTAVRVQPGLSFSETSALSHWRSRPALSEISPVFYLNLRADHSATDEVENLDGTVTPLRENSWSIDGGTLVTTSYRLPDGSAAASCPAGVSCTIRNQRSWTLLRDDASGVFVLERANLSDTDTRYRIMRYERSTP